MYKLSEAAAGDIEGILTRSMLDFGLERAETYVQSLTQCLELLGDHPEMGSTVDEIHPGYRCFPHGSRPKPSGLNQVGGIGKEAIMSDQHPVKTPYRHTLTSQKPPLKLREVWSICIRLQIGKKKRDLALFSLAIDRKLYSCNLVTLRVADVAPGRSSQGTCHRNTTEDGAAAANSTTATFLKATERSVTSQHTTFSNMKFK